MPKSLPTNHEVGLKDVGLKDVDLKNVELKGSDLKDSNKKEAESKKNVLNDSNVKRISLDNSSAEKSINKALSRNVNKNMSTDNNVLKKIVDNKRQELIKRKQKTPIESLKLGLKPSKRSLKDALSQRGNRFILEYKKASPSRGDIRPDLTVEQCVNAYRASADAISVLTDKKYFNGGHHLLKAVAEQVTQPVLCKDFFIDEYQIYEARYFQADAILLMLSVLTDEEYKHLKSIADELNLDVLTEVHTEDEAKRAVALGAPIIGINNRDLTILKTNLSVTERIAPTIPSDRIIISESGIDDRGDVTRLAHLVDGFLVGTSLMKQDNIEAAAKALVYGAVKVCGVRDVETAQHCFDCGASYVGFMFYSQSKRFVDTELAQQVSREVPGQYVGVFVTHNIEQITKTAIDCNLQVVQLHGEQSFDDAKKIKFLTKVELWKALTLRSVSDIAAITQWLDIADKVLLDYKSEQSFGGTGESFDWRLLAEVFSEVDSERIVVAGGINSQNLSELFKYPVKALDLSSGVESSPGVKDFTMLSTFFNHCRSNGNIFEEKNRND